MRRAQAALVALAALVLVAGVRALPRPEAPHDPRTPWPASTYEREVHDLHHDLEIRRLCKTMAPGVWPCPSATPSP